MFWITNGDGKEELKSKEELINYFKMLINDQMEFLICEESENNMGIPYVQAFKQDETQMHFEFQDTSNPNYEWVNWGKTCSQDECLSYFVEYYNGTFKPMYDGWEEIKPY